jgi:3-vinyl bacteriochlorophyllide hydratase
MQANSWDWSHSTQYEAKYLPPSERSDRKPGVLDRLIDNLIEIFAPCPWPSSSGLSAPFQPAQKEKSRALYTAEERRRRDATGWTTVQGVLAPIQFAVFLVSLVLVLNYLLRGQGYEVATATVVLKTFVLYAIMITGSIWEKKVFGKYLFAPAFFWEDAVSMLVIGLHTAYLAALLSDWASPNARMLLALAAYATYVINATQFVLKLRAARLETPRTISHAFIESGVR